MKTPRLSPAIKSGLLALLAVACWLSLLAQLYLIIENRQMSIPATVVQYFSYFTILTNWLVAIYATSSWIFPATTLGKWLNRSGVPTAITLYILVVGIVYNTVLRFQWQPQGLQQLTDEGLHSVVPVLMLLYWYLFTTDHHIHYPAVTKWLLYPGFYLLYLLVRGAFTNRYPYPFMDVAQIGYARVAVNSLLVLLLFVVLGTLLIWMGKKLSRQPE